jgi:malate dehydrogenase (oxaloacetate-decarboxylating)
VVVLAALTNALKVVGKRMQDLKIIVSGVGAAGVACSKMILAAGARNLIGFDRTGAIHKDRIEQMNPAKQWFAENTNPNGFRGSIREALAGADLFLGLSAPGVIEAQDLAKMRPDAIVFALANPTPEVMPEQATNYVRIVATGRSDYPNQINNVLCFPGIFRGALDVGAKDINEEMKLAAARAIAAVVPDNALNEEYIIPGVFNAKVAAAVAHAVAQAAVQTGVARREVTTDTKTSE